jgi:hypothetical protein
MVASPFLQNNEEYKTKNQAYLSLGSLGRNTNFLLLRNFRSPKVPFRRKEAIFGVRKQGRQTQKTNIVASFGREGESTAMDVRGNSRQRLARLKI